MSSPDRGMVALPPQTEEQKAAVLAYLRRRATRPAFAVLDGRDVGRRISCGCCGIPSEPREVPWPKY